MKNTWNKYKVGEVVHKTLFYTNDRRLVTIVKVGPDGYSIKYSDGKLSLIDQWYDHDFEPATEVEKALYG